MPKNSKSWMLLKVRHPHTERAAKQIERFLLWQVKREEASTQNQLIQYFFAILWYFF